MTNRQILDKISEKIGELSVQAVVHEQTGDKENASICRKAIKKLMEFREKIMEDNDEK